MVLALVLARFLPLDGVLGGNYASRHARSWSAAGNVGMSMRNCGTSELVRINQTRLWT